MQPHGVINFIKTELINFPKVYKSTTEVLQEFMNYKMGEKSNVALLPSVQSGQKYKKVQFRE